MHVVSYNKCHIHLTSLGQNTKFRTVSHTKILLSLMKLNLHAKSPETDTNATQKLKMTIIMCLAARNPIAMSLSNSLKKIKFELYSFTSHSCVAWSDGFKRFSTHFFLLRLHVASAFCILINEEKQRKTYRKRRRHLLHSSSSSSSARRTKNNSHIARENRQSE